MVAPTQSLISGTRPTHSSWTTFTLNKTYNVPQKWHSCIGSLVLQLLCSFSSWDILFKHLFINALFSLLGGWQGEGLVVVVVVSQHAALAGAVVFKIERLWCITKCTQQTRCDRFAVKISFEFRYDAACTDFWAPHHPAASTSNGGSPTWTLAKLLQSAWVHPSLARRHCARCRLKLCHALLNICHPVWHQIDARHAGCRKMFSGAAFLILTQVKPNSIRNFLQ